MSLFHDAAVVMTTETQRFAKENSWIVGSYRSVISINQSNFIGINHKVRQKEAGEMLRDYGENTNEMAKTKSLSMNRDINRSDRPCLWGNKFCQKDLWI